MVDTFGATCNTFTLLREGEGEREREREREKGSSGESRFSFLLCAEHFPHHSLRSRLTLLRELLAAGSETNNTRQRETYSIQAPSRRLSHCMHCTAESANISHIYYAAHASNFLARLIFNHLVCPQNLLATPTTSLAFGAVV
jgi:hypothetical protein